MRLPCQISKQIATAYTIKLEVQGEHTAESHVQDKVSKFLSIPQSAALQQMVATNPMVSSTAVLRGLELLLETHPCTNWTPSNVFTPSSLPPTNTKSCRTIRRGRARRAAFRAALSFCASLHTALSVRALLNSSYFPSKFFAALTI